MPELMSQPLLANFADFHWQRPLWLVLIPLAIVCSWYLLRSQARSNNWRSLIAPQLLPHLLQGSLSKQQKMPFFGLALALIIAALAMAGPSWEKLPLPVFKSENALVILLDLSPSMMAQDIKPSRLVRARLKLIDLLQQRREGLTALVVYAGEAHTVTPLTDDTETIISMLPSLSPAIMPLRGSNTEMAMQQALTLFRDAGILEGEILLVTDGVASAAQDYLANNLDRGFRLSVLGVGSDEGAPIPVRNGGFAKDNSGSIVLAKLNSGDLRGLAQRCGGIYRSLSHTDSDIKALLHQRPLHNSDSQQVEREFDTWLDRGAWLCLLLIPFLLCSFRRGWLLLGPIFLLPVLLVLPQQSQAFGWKDLWYNRDQQGQQLLQQQHPAEAVQAFERQDWKGAAAYRAGDYETAAQALSGLDNARDHYNRGNALARSGKLQEALDAYDSALQKDPQLTDAAANRELVESLLKQQQDQQQDQSQQGEQQQDQSQQGGQQQGDQQQNSGEQDSEQGENPGQQQDNRSDQRSDAASADDSTPTDQREDQQNASRENQDEKAEDKETGATTEQESQQDSTAQHALDSQSEADEEQAAAAGAQESDLSPEEQQAMEQWLRKIPDDPSGLMRKKFEHQYRQRLKQYQQGSWQPPVNGANGRW